MRVILLSGMMLLSSACVPAVLNEPQSLGEINASYSYIPLDPLPVDVSEQASCALKISDAKTLLDSLPDNAVRISIRQLSAKGGIELGPAAVGLENNTYQVTLDYINADTANVRFLIGVWVKNSDEPNNLRFIPISNEKVPEGELVVERSDTAKGVENRPNVVIPVYVGVGLRLTATVQVIKGKVNLSSLGAIAASVEAERSAGSLVVQTLGINGKQVAASLPLPSELNSTTIQNAI